MTSSLKTRTSICTLSLLVTHQADAAWQREWELFRVPGGIEFFLVFNFVAVVFLLMSFVKKIERTSCNKFWLFLLPVTGIFTFAIHAYFIAMGFPHFTQVGSLLILFLLLLSSSLEVWLEIKGKLSAHF
jgi:hypothetical protein